MVVWRSTGNGTYQASVVFTASNQNRLPFALGNISGQPFSDIVIVSLSDSDPRNGLVHTLASTLDGVAIANITSQPCYTMPEADISGVALVAVDPALEGSPDLVMWSPDVVVVKRRTQHGYAVLSRKFCLLYGFVDDQYPVHRVDSPTSRLSCKRTSEIRSLLHVSYDVFKAIPTVDSL